MGRSGCPCKICAKVIVGGLLAGPVSFVGILQCRLKDHSQGDHKPATSPETPLRLTDMASYTRCI